MFKLNLGAKIGLIFGGLGALVGLAAPIATMGIEGIFISAIMLAIFFPFTGFFRPFFGSNKLLKSGEQRQARILETWDTGVTVNNSPQVGMLLEITKSNGQKYQTKAKMLISRLQVSYIQPGADLVVRVDPEDDNKVAVESIGSLQNPVNAPSTTNSALASENYQAKLEKYLLQVDLANQELVKTGVQAKAKVIWYFDLNIKVNGDNPYVLIVLEVQPSDGTPFIAEIQGAISVQSVSKFQQGSMITVRYDQNDKTKVTVEHSGI